MSMDTVYISSHQKRVSGSVICGQATIFFVRVLMYNGIWRSHSTWPSPGQCVTTVTIGYPVRSVSVCIQLTKYY